MRAKKVKCRMFVSKRAFRCLPTINRRVGICACLCLHRSTVVLCKFLAGSSLRLFGLLVSIDKVNPGKKLTVLSTLDASSLQFTMLSKSSGTVSGTPKMKTGATRHIVLRLGSGVSLRSTFRGGDRRMRALGVSKGNRIEGSTIVTLATLKCSSTRDLGTMSTIRVARRVSIRTILGTTLGRVSLL